jgi:hypothetical protein
VERLKIPAVQLQHGHTGKTRQGASRESGSAGVYRETAPQ